MEVDIGGELVDNTVEGIDVVERQTYRAVDFGMVPEGGVTPSKG